MGQPLIFSYKKSPRNMCAGMILWVIKCRIPDSRKDDSDKKENQSCHKDVAVAMLFGLAELARTVIGILFVPCSAHRDKGEHNISKNKSDTDERPLATDIHHARKERHQYA